MKRPSGSNADEWHLFLCEYLDNRATGSGDGLAFIAVQIAEALDDLRAERMVSQMGGKKMSDDAQDPFLHDPAAFERMIGEMERMHGWQPIETAPADRDVLLWVPPSDMLSDLIAGHMEVGRAWGDGRATHWMPLPEPPKASEPRAVTE